MLSSTRVFDGTERQAKQWLLPWVGHEKTGIIDHCLELEYFMLLSIKFFKKALNSLSQYLGEFSLFSSHQKFGF